MLEVEFLVRFSGACVTKAKLRVSAAVLGACFYVLLHGLTPIAKHL
jgi:hypothetical protein